MSGPAYIKTHRAAGRPISYQGSAAGLWCGGSVRTLYARGGAGGKSWTRAGWVCASCGMVELVAGLVEGRKSWRALEGRGRLVGELEHVAVAGQLGAFDGAGDVDTAPREAE